MRGVNTMLTALSFLAHMCRGSAFNIMVAKQLHEGL